MEEFAAVRVALRPEHCGISIPEGSSVRGSEKGVRAWRTGAWVKRLGLVGLFLPGKCSRQAKHFFSCFLVCEGYHVCQLLAQCCVVYREGFSGHYSWGLLPSNWEN